MASGGMVIGLSISGELPFENVGVADPRAPAGQRGGTDDGWWGFYRPTASRATLDRDPSGDEALDLGQSLASALQRGDLGLQGGHPGGEALVLPLGLSQPGAELLRLHRTRFRQPRGGPKRLLQLGEPRLLPLQGGLGLLEDLALLLPERLEFENAGQRLVSFLGQGLGLRRQLLRDAPTLLGRRLQGRERFVAAGQLLLQKADLVAGLVEGPRQRLPLRQRLVQAGAQLPHRIPDDAGGRERIEGGRRRRRRRQPAAKLGDLGLSFLDHFGAGYGPQGPKRAPR